MNAFLDLADFQIAGPVKARQRAAEKRAARRAGGADQEKLSRQWRQWHEERRAALLAREHGHAAGVLAEFLDGMTLHDGAALIAFAAPLQAADADTRHEVLALIDNAIVALRERHGLPAFDDPLPGEPANVLLKIREALT